jgi:hypothetical protein
MERRDEKKNVIAAEVGGNVKSNFIKIVAASECKLSSDPESSFLVRIQMTCQWQFLLLVISSKSLQPNVSFLRNNYYSAPRAPARTCTHRSSH